MPLLPSEFLTIEAVKADRLVKEIPEFFELKNVIENNRSHDHDSVFVHNINTAEGLIHLIAGSGPSVRTYLEEEIDRFTKRHILILAGLFHDIGKLYTEEREGEYNRFPGHEAVGAVCAEAILARFDFPASVRARIVTIVAQHGVLHEVVHEQQVRWERWKAARSAWSDIIVELVLLVIADTGGARKPALAEQNACFKIDFFQSRLK